MVPVNMPTMEQVFYVFACEVGLVPVVNMVRTILVYLSTAKCFLFLATRMNIDSSNSTLSLLTTIRQ